MEANIVAPYRVCVCVCVVLPSPQYRVAACECDARALSRECITSMLCVLNA